MKGFGIEIKNTLLEPKHVAGMDVSIWLYLWFLDKLTSVSESGVGLVLGGKPVVYAEIKDELGISERTYNRWISILRSGGYISTRRTPHGIVFSVRKAYKRFGNRTAKSGGTLESDTPNMSESSAKNGVSDTPHSADVIKTEQLDIAVDRTRTNQCSGAAGSEVAQLIKVFVDAGTRIAYGNKTQRDAASRLVETHGFGKALAGAKAAVELNGKPYFPVTTTPYELERNWVKLKACMEMQREKSKKSNILVI